MGGKYEAYFLSDMLYEVKKKNVMQIYKLTALGKKSTKIK